MRTDYNSRQNRFIRLTTRTGDKTTGHLFGQTTPQRNASRLRKDDFQKNISDVLFEDFKLGKFLLRGLQEAGIEEMTPIQEKTIPAVSAGKDVLGIAPTGTGKTIAFLLPVIRNLNYSKEGAPRCLILVPSKELVMQIADVAETLTKYINLRITRAYGGGSKKDQIASLENGTDIVVATPGRLQELIAIRALNPRHIKHFIVDEADTLMDQGFLPQLNLVLDSLPERRQNLLFSATFTHETQEIANSFMNNPTKIVVGEIKPPANIKQQAYDAVNIKTKLNLLADLLNDSETFTKTIVFTESRKVADRTQQFLHHRLFTGKAQVIHSNKTENFRFRAIEEFKTGEATVLVATSVAAKGIDIDDVSHVINFEVPKEYEEYVHRIGRTGRQGKYGEAITLVEPEEMPDFENIQALTGTVIPLMPLPEGTMLVEMAPRKPTADRHGNSVKKHKVKEIERGPAFHEKKDKNKKTNQRVKAMPHLSAKAKKSLGLKSNGRPRKRRK
ncbi:DEAD/DEAH box helicase [Fulvitalea axinellae]|uniref:DEAD/DEAH box helicase n=1 Tax=Fulvitalea axinellae TaxID=1182444 RepID=UPI0030CA271D